MLTDAIRGALLAVGRSVLDADVAATPTVGVLVRHHEAAGAIQVSASHNPPEYNGIKLFSQTGQVLSAAEGEQVVERFHQGEISWVTYQHIGQAQLLEDTLSRHAEMVLRTVDVAAIRQRGFRVLLDSNHGAGSRMGRHILRELGCQVTILGGEPDGDFAHPPEPTAENLASVCDKVVAAGAEVGFCQDPDADRLALIDEQGRYIGEEYTVADLPGAGPARAIGPGGDQLLHQSHVGRPGEEIWCTLLSRTGGRSQRGAHDETAAGDLRRRRKWRTD